MLISAYLSFGETWYRAGGPEGGDISAIEVFDSIVIAGAYPGGIYRSTNMADSWSQCSGTRAFWITGFGRLGSLLVAASESGSSYPFTLSFSSDTGKSWFENPNEWNFLGIEEMCVHKNRIFIKVQKGGFFRSDDTAKTWVWLDTIIPQASGSFINITDFYDNGNTLYAAADAGVMSTKDGGETWENISGDIPKASYTAYESNVPRVLSVAASGDTIFAAKYSEVYRSVNNGKNWSRVLKFESSDALINDISISKNYIMLTRHGSIYLSFDGGNKWEKSDSTFPFMGVNLIKKTGSCFFSTTSGGIFKSPDGLHNWVSCHKGILSHNIGTLTTFDSSILAGSSGAGVFESKNDSIWKRFCKDSLRTWIMAMTSSDSATFIATYGDGSNRCGLFKYQNKKIVRLNLNFRPTEKPADYFRTIKFTDGLLCVCPSGGLYVSNDNGNSFKEIKPEILGESVVFAVTNHNKTLFLGTSKGFFIYNFEKDSISSPNLISFRTLAKNSKYLFGGGSGTLMRSSDFGITWETTSLLLPSAIPVVSINCREDTIYCATEGMGVFRSTDNGDNWQTFNEGLSCLGVQSILNHNGKLYAGTIGGSVFALNISNSVEVSNSKSIERKSLRKSFKIRSGKKEISLVASQNITAPFTIKVITISGRIVACRRIDHISKGSAVSFPVKSKNMYFIMIDSDKKVLTFYN